MASRRPAPRPGTDTLNDPAPGRPASPAAAETKVRDSCACAGSGGRHTPVNAAMNAHHVILVIEISLKMSSGQAQMAA